MQITTLPRLPAGPVSLRAPHACLHSFRLTAASLQHRRRSQSCSSVQRQSRNLAGQGCKIACSASTIQTAAASSSLPISPQVIGVFAAVALLVLAIKKVLDTPSRTYDPENPNVGESYDDWERDGVLEHYWGEHIHLGHYSEEERRRGYPKKDFKQAKFDFIDEMLAWSGAQQPKRILDVGCGIGGTSRHLAAKFPEAQVQGITLSPNQVRRATELAQERNLGNVSFAVMDALKMEFEDDTFDLVWACESGEHMPDKRKYVEEMTRVLKPGGKLVIATWCQREETPATPFSQKDKDALQFLYDEWTHPYFISKEEYGRIMQGTGKLESVHTEDWTPQTLPTWRHSIMVGVWDPWIVVFKGPIVWYRTIREIVTIERMHRAFNRGLMEYGMARAVKAGGSAAQSSAVAAGRVPFVRVPATAA